MEHPLKLYNSLTRQIEDFIPQNSKRVTMYNCGPTVYSYAHIGNARAAVVADVLFRVLRHIYGEEHVIYARNITDIDDKIIAAANEQGVDISEITEKYAKIYNDDLAALGCLPPTYQPKATEHIGDMINMIQSLLDNGYAYRSDGHVFFDVSKYEDYGKLSGNTLDALKAGNRVGEGEVARKKNSADFVLWKPELDGVGWDAPLGENGENMRGRPGWHIECSAMAKAKLCDDEYGQTIDIHCGGVDLKFPHHENEKAQSCCANGTEKFAKFWVHNEFLNMGSEKMSKSLGNVKLIHDLLEDWDGEVIRLALLKAHYRSELVWSEDLLKESKAQLDRWYRTLKLTKEITGGNFIMPYDAIVRSLLEDIATPIFIETFEVLRNSRNDEVNQFEIELSDFIANKTKEETLEFLNQSPFAETLFALKHTANLIGLLQKDPEEWFKGGLDTDKFDRLVKEYDAARAEALEAKQSGDKAKMGELFSRVDAIRADLQNQGIVIETGPDGSSWRKA